MSISAQETQNGNLPGGNGRRMQFGQFQFSTTDATGSLKLNLSKLEHIAIQPTGTVATDETVTPPQIPIGGLVVDSTGTITVSRTGAAKTSGLICSYMAVGWCLLLGMFLLAGTGCASAQKPAAPSPAEVVAWDGILKNVVGAFRAGIAAQPPGPRRDALLAEIDAVSSWEALGAAVSEAVAAGFQVPAAATTTRPTAPR